MQFKRRAQELFLSNSWRVSTGLSPSTQARTPFAGWIFAERARVTGEIPTQSPLLLTIAVGVVVMVLIGGLACTAPTLRALRIMPTEARARGGNVAR